MKRTLGINKKYALFISTLGLIILAIVLVSVGIIIQSESAALKNKLGEVLRLSYSKSHETMIIGHAEYFSYDIFNSVYYLDIKRIHRLIKKLKAELPVESVWIADTSGKVLTDGTEENPSFGKKLTTDISLLKSKRLLITRLIDGHVVAFTIGSNDHIAGYGEIRFSDKLLKDTIQQQDGMVFSMLKEIKKRFTGIALTGILLIVFFTIFLSFLYSRTLASPLLKLRDATRKIAKGELHYRLEVQSRDELGDLSDSFNRMADELLKTTVSKEYVDNIIRNMNDALIVVSTDGRIKTVNQATLTLLGYTHDELLNQPFEIILKEEKMASEGTRINDLLNEGSPVIRNIEKIYFSKDGRKIPVLLSGSVMHNGEGKIQGLVYVALDITERKAAEEELRKHREHLEELVKNRTIDLMEANKQLQEEINERKQIEESLIKSEEETRCLAQENATVAEIGRIISSTLDIQKVYERFAEEAHKLISFDRLTIDTIDPDKRTVTVVYSLGFEIIEHRSGSSFPLAGTFAELLVRKRAGGFIQAENEKEMAERYPGFVNVFRAATQSKMSVPLISKDKVIGVLNFRSTKANAYSERDLKLAERVGNQIAGAIANSQLFSERIRAEEEKAALEEQLRQSQKIEGIGRLAGSIAHDFDNLLTVMKSKSELLLIKVKKGNPLRKYIEEILRASQRASFLTYQLLAFSHRQISEFKVLNLNTILGDMDKIFRRILGEEIELDIRFAEGIGKVKTNLAQIEQAILSLVLNARDAMPSGGKLLIETANVDLDEVYTRTRIGIRPGHYVMLSISDTGVGMTPEVKKHLFEPFFTTKEKGKGTGLSLSTTYGIVKQSEGDIWVSSEPGKGTIFKIHFPRVEEEPNTRSG